MKYSLRIRGSAAKELQRVTKVERLRIAQAFEQIAENPFAGRVLKGELRALRRLRVGSYRLLYEVQDDPPVVHVVRVAHQSQAYRRK